MHMFVAWEGERGGRDVNTHHSLFDTWWALVDVVDGKPSHPSGLICQNYTHTKYSSCTNSSLKIYISILYDI